MIYTVVEEQPEYPGGLREMMKFISKNINFSEFKSDSVFCSKFFIQFVIDETGNAISPIVKKDCRCNSCNNELIRIINTMPKWKPGKSKGRAVKTYFNLPINTHIQ